MPRPLIETDPQEARRLLAVHLDEVRAAASLMFLDGKAYDVADRARVCVRDVFGATSREYEAIKSLEFMPKPFPMTLVPPGTRSAQAARALQRRAREADALRWASTLNKSVATWARAFEDYIAQVGEHLDDATPAPAFTQAQAIANFNSYDLHPAIRGVSRKLFHDGHPRQAVEDAYRALEKLVQDRSGVTDRDNSGLMDHVFRRENTVLAVNDGVTDSDRNEQMGMQRLFSGAALAIRNPRAHGLVQDEYSDALDCIVFLSMLAKVVDAAQKRP